MGDGGTTKFDVIPRFEGKPEVPWCGRFRAPRDERPMSGVSEIHRRDVASSVLSLLEMPELCRTFSEGE